jgi:hypothetical protein
MKAQFKYAFKTGLSVRSGVFAVIFVMNTVFIVLGSLGLLPLAAHITAVSLGGVAIAVMLAFNIISDIAIIRRMFSAPQAYLYALTPVPRWKIILASVIAMAVLDFVTMAVVITAEVWLSFNLVGGGIWRIVWDAINMNYAEYLYRLWHIPLLAAGYFFIMMLIIFCVTVKQSYLFKKPASGLLVFLLACGCLYIFSLLQLVLLPFGTVERYGIYIIITLGMPGIKAAFPLYVLLILLETAGLFILSSKLMERRINI